MKFQEQKHYFREFSRLPAPGTPGNKGDHDTGNFAITKKHHVPSMGPVALTIQGCRSGFAPDDFDIPVIGSQLLQGTFLYHIFEAL